MLPPNSLPSRKAIVLHQGALGDFLLMLPALDGLHASCPNIRMEFLIRKEYAALICTKPYFEGSLPPDDAAISPFFHEELWEEATIPSCFRDADMSFVFGQASSRVLVERLSRRLASPVYWIQSFPGPGGGAGRPVSRFIKEQMRALGYRVADTAWRLHPEEQEEHAAKAWLREKGMGDSGQPVLIHPGSGGKKKAWPLMGWWELFRRLRQRRQEPLIMTLGPADDFLVPLAKEAQSLGIHVLEGLSLPRLAAFLSVSRLFIGSDSGVSHLAAAVGVPTVVIFGPTDPAIWSPVGRSVHIVRGQWEESEILRWVPDSDKTPVGSHLRDTLEVILSFAVQSTSPT